MRFPSHRTTIDFDDRSSWHQRVLLLATRSAERTYRPVFEIDMHVRSERMMLPEDPEFNRTSTAVAPVAQFVTIAQILWRDKSDDPRRDREVLPFFHAGAHELHRIAKGHCVLTKPHEFAGCL